MKLTTKVDKNSFSPNPDDQRTVDEKMHVSPAIGNTSVCVQRSCLCDESRSLDGRRGAAFTIKPVACCVALRSRVVNDVTGASVRAERTVKRL